MFDVGIIRWLQAFRAPVLDAIFQTFSWVGDGLVYTLVIPILYWAVSREKAHRLAVVLLSSFWLNGLLKEWLALPRPDPASGILRLAEASGPGFPSGHAQLSVAFWGWLAVEFPRPLVIAVALAMILFVSLSRLYLGVHFPADVLGGWAFGLLVAGIAAVAWARRPAKADRPAWRFFWAVGVPLLLLPLYQTSGAERALGFLMGLWAGDLVAFRSIPYDERAPWGLQTLRVSLGLASFFALVMLVERYVPSGLPSIVGWAVVAVWVTVGAPSFFLGTRLAKPPWELQQKARQRRIPSIASPSRPSVALFVAVTLLAGAAAGASRYLVPSRPDPRPSSPIFATQVGPLSLAHRGGAGLAPEDTLLSFGEGLRWGANWLELDVHLTADGQVAVIHDDTVDRTTNGEGRVQDLPLAALQGLDAAFRFSPDGVSFPYRGQGVRIPTLDEALEAYPAARFIIEMKGTDPRLADLAVAAVDRAGARPRVLFASFDGALIRRARELAPDVVSSSSMDEAMRAIVMMRLGLGAFWQPPARVLQVPERYGALPVVTESLLRLAREKRVAVHVWTINDLAEMRRLAALGVDGIVTDYPDRMAQVLSERAKESGIR